MREKNTARQAERKSVDNIDVIPYDVAFASLPLVQADALTVKEIVFIESNVVDYQGLIDGIKPGVEVHVLDASGDGLAQIAEILAGRSGIDAVHILSHGSEGAVQLGALTLTAHNIETRSGELAEIGQALSADADILLYGCDVAADADGKALVDRLAVLTGADVAASDDLTGSAYLKADWDLEFLTGEQNVEAKPLVLTPYGSTLVNNTLDFSSDIVSNFVTATHPTANFGTINLKIVDNANSTGTARASLTDATTGQVNGSFSDFYYSGSTGKYLVVYSDGREFSFQSVKFGSYGSTVYSSLTAYAYRDGILLGSQTISTTFPSGTS
ncbi:MAG: DUF4347 domain-containing protein, partial [Methylovulum sp.]